MVNTLLTYSIKIDFFVLKIVPNVSLTQKLKKNFRARHNYGFFPVE